MASPPVVYNLFEREAEIEWNFRFLNPGDIAELKDLCQVWFPVRYPDMWYNDVTSGKYYSLAAVHPYDGHILGIIVCGVKSLDQVNQEDGYLLCSKQASCLDTQVAYILSLGVTDSCRRKQLGSTLLNKLLSYLTSPVMQTVKVVYLHVLATNTPAIKFYEKHSFVQHLYLPFYYHIAGSCCDARSYALYINGGKPPQTVISQLRGRLRRLFRIAFRLCYCRFAALRIAASIRSLFK